MRKVTRTIARAFFSGDSESCGNTRTDGHSLWLHGHKIARKTDEGIEINNCGYQTNVTKERLNGILSLTGNGGRIFQKNFKWKFSEFDRYGDFPSNQWVNINNILEVE